MPTDPVCGMFVPEEGSLHSIVDGQTYYFCSKTCQERFESPETESAILKRRLAVAWALSIPIIVLTYSLSSNFSIGFLTRNVILLILALPVQLYSGFGFYRGAYHAIRGRMGNMDVLVSLGTVTAFVYSTYVTLKFSSHGQEVFFDASAFIITLILTGAYTEGLTKARANRAAGRLVSLLPQTVLLIDEGGNTTVRQTDEIRKGDRILVKAGEIIPADGTVRGGKSEVDESMLTGEQEPVLKVEGSPVTSGTLNLNGALTVEVGRIGKDSTVNQIYELIQRAVSGRAKVQKIADVFSSVFVPIVLAAATASSLFWYFYLRSIGSTIPVEISILAFVSVVVIACPCAIGLAGPITLLISSSHASRNGIVIKNPSSLDRLSKVSRVIFDKTGTLTEPVPIISDITAHGNHTRDEVLLLAYSVESYSNHPIARAICQEARKKNLAARKGEGVEELPGIGIMGRVDGREVRIKRSTKGGSSTISVMSDGEEIGTIAMSYKLRDNAPWVISKFREMGIRTAIVTGDSKSEGKRIAEMLRIDDVFSEAMPEDKSKIVIDYQEKGDYVMFVGDGINDSIALETADVGIAMGSGSDVARESGDIILLSNDLRQLVMVRILGLKTVSKIKQNIAWAVGYNSVLIPVAGGVLVPSLGFSIYTILPMLSALAMGLSSTSVVLNSLTLNGIIDRAWKGASSGLPGNP